SQRRRSCGDSPASHGWHGRVPRSCALPSWCSPGSWGLITMIHLVNRIKKRKNRLKQIQKSDHSMHPRTSIDQWRVLAAVVDQGGFAAAARHLHRSQSAVSYAIAQLQKALGTRLLQVVGRKARLTPAGEHLLRRSRSILDQLARLEALAHAIE